MTKIMRCVVLTVSVALSAAIVSAAPGDTDAERDQDAKQVAAAWFVSLMRGDTAVTTALSAVPFSFDRKHEIPTLAKLKELYDRIVADKGKRDIKPGSVTIRDSSPQAVVVGLTIEGDDEEIAITVKPGSACRVTGFSD